MLVGDHDNTLHGRVEGALEVVGTGRGEGVAEAEALQHLAGAPAPVGGGDRVREDVVVVPGDGPAGVDRNRVRHEEVGLHHTAWQAAGGGPVEVQVRAVGPVAGAARVEVALRTAAGLI